MLSGENPLKLLGKNSYLKLNFCKYYFLTPTKIQPISASLQQCGTYKLFMRTMWLPKPPLSLLIYSIEYLQKYWRRIRNTLKLK